MQLAKQRIPKQAKSSTAKVRQICQEYLDESTATPAGDLQCNLSNVLVKCTKNFLWKATEKEVTPRKIEDEKQIRKKAILFE